MEVGFARGIGSHSAEGLTSRYFLSLANGDAAQVAVDGDITAVAHHDILESADGEYGCYLTIEDAASLCPGSFPN